MKEKILERYDSNGDGRLIIDVSASKVDELAAYLTACVREIGLAEFVIRITLGQMVLAAELQARIRTSLHKCFMCQRELELASVKRLLRCPVVPLC